MKIIAFVALIAAACSTACLAQAPGDEVSLRQADAMQMRIIVEQDTKAQRDFMHSNYMVNAPSNRVIRKDEVVTMLANGQIANETFERTIEAVSITGDVGITMGRETVTPGIKSEIGTKLGKKSLERRFTNVFLWDSGRWRFLARQAAIVIAP